MVCHFQSTGRSSYKVASWSYLVGHMSLLHHNEYLPAHVMYFWISVKVVTILTNPVQLGKDPGGVHTPTPQVHVTSFFVYPEPMV